MKHPIRRRLMYLGFQGLQALVKVLPLAAIRLLGRALGLAAYGLLVHQRRLAMEHLAYAFGDRLSPSARARIARGVFLNLGHNAVEWLLLPRLSAGDLERMTTCEGLEHLRRALAEGNGAIVVTAHFGNWEVIPLFLKSIGFDGAVLARRLRYAEYESFLISLRGAKGIPTLARGSLKEVAKLLRANQIVGVLPDQDVDSLEGVFVEFFGRRAYTPVGPAALSLMTGAPIIPCFMIREGARFRLIIEPPVRPPQAADRARAAALLTQAWSDVIESYIRRYPDQWVWMHRRWKTQPNSVRSPKSEVRSSDSRLQAPSSGLQASGSRLQAAHGLQVVRSLLLLAACCLLLAGTQGCAKSGPPEGKPQATAASSPEPQADQAMSEFTLNGYNEEKSTRWTLNGQGANLDGNIVTIHRPDAVGYDPARTAYLTASLAQMNQQDRSIRMEHDVTIHTSDGLWFASPILYWIPDHDQVATDQPVRIETDHMLLRGRGMDGFTQLKQAIILQDIELVLNPGTHEAPAEEPSQVTITCDGPLAFDYEHHVATFERNVHVKDASGDLYSDKLVAYLDPATHTIRYADAIGRVRIHQDQNTALSERAVYEPALGKVTLLGKPSLLVYPSSSGGSKGTQLSFGGLIAAPGEATKASAPIEPQKRADAPAPGKLAE